MAEGAFCLEGTSIIGLILKDDIMRALSDLSQKGLPVRRFLEKDDLQKFFPRYSIKKNNHDVILLVNRQAELLGTFTLAELTQESEIINTTEKNTQEKSTANELQNEQKNATEKNDKKEESFDPLLQKTSAFESKLPDNNPQTHTSFETIEGLAENTAQNITENTEENNAKNIAKNIDKKRENVAISSMPDLPARAQEQIQKPVFQINTPLEEKGSDDFPQKEKKTGEKDKSQSPAGRLAPDNAETAQMPPPANPPPFKEAGSNQNAGSVPSLHQDNAEKKQGASKYMGSEGKVRYDRSVQKVRTELERARLVTATLEAISIPLIALDLDGDSLFFNDEWVKLRAKYPGRLDNLLILAAVKEMIMERALDGGLENDETLNLRGLLRSRLIKARPIRPENNDLPPAGYLFWLEPSPLGEVPLNSARKSLGNFSGRTLPDILAEEERRAIVWALEQAGGNQSNAALLLGIPRQTFAYKLKRLGSG